MSDPESDTRASPPPSAVVLRATREEAAGASLRVAGLSVLERAVRQLGRSPQIQVTIDSDGTIAIPSALPPNVTARRRDEGGEGTEGSEEHTDPDNVGTTGNVGTVKTIGADVVRRNGADFENGMRVVDEATRLAAEDAIFSDLLRGDLGFIARHINKKISFRITRHVLCQLAITPNQVTLGAAAIGFLGCMLIASGARAAMVTGFLLVQVQSVLDGCDGELARVRFQQTPIGEWLDTVVDDAMNLTVVASMGVGLWRAGAGWPAALTAATACSMYLVYNVISYRELIRQKVGGDLIRIRWKLMRGQDVKSVVAGGSGGTPPSGVARLRQLLLPLGRRDAFIFGWLVLAVVDMVPVALLWALLMATACFVMAMGQVVVRDTPA